MTAAYPVSIKSFTTKVDFSGTVLAEHINSLQDEVNAIQVTLGTSIATGSGWVGEFDLVTSNWSTLKDRITNIEYGIKDLFDLQSGYVSKTGGSSIVSSTNGTTSLIVKSKSGQTANLAEFQTSTATVVTKIKPDGTIFTRGKELVPVIYAATQPTGSDFAAGTLWIDSSVDVNPTPSVTIETVTPDFSELLLIGA